MRTRMYLGVPDYMEAFNFYLGELLAPQIKHQLYVEIIETTDCLSLETSTGRLTFDSDNYYKGGIYHAIIYLYPHMSLNAKLKVLAHETVHLKQLVAGELSVNRDYLKCWKGQPYLNMSSCDRDYANLPWEVEALKLQEKLYSKYMRED